MYNSGKFVTSQKLRASPLKRPRGRQGQNGRFGPQSGELRSDKNLSGHYEYKMHK